MICGVKVGGCCPLVWVGSSSGILVQGSCGHLSEAHDRKQSDSEGVCHFITPQASCHFRQMCGQLHLQCENK